MTNDSMKLDWQKYDIRWLAVGASLLLSVFTLLTQDIPNSDAYTYAKTAEIFLADGFKAAYEHYSWASYSVLIGILSWTGIDVFSAGLLVNAFFYAVLVYAYLSIIKEIRDSDSLLALAAVCILVYPQLNEFRELLIRDIGFWAFSLLGFWQYLQYAKSGSTRSALFYGSSFLIAAAFRAEAIFYLLLTPLVLLVDSELASKERRALCVRLLGIVVGLSLGCLLLLSLLGLNVAQLFIDFASIYEPFTSGNFTLNDEERVLLGSLLFTDYAATFSREYIELFLLAGMIAILLSNSFSAMGGPYLIVLAIGLLRKQLRLERRIAAPLLLYVASNLLILLGFIILTRYLSSRYAMLMCLLLALFVPLVILHLLESASPKNKTSILYALALFLAYCAIDSYYSFGESKDYLDESIAWLEQNTDANAGLVTNNHAIAYFSGRLADYDLVTRNLVESEILNSEIGDTIAAELTFETGMLLEKPAVAEKLKLLTEFPNSDAPRIAFYERIE